MAHKMSSNTPCHYGKGNNMILLENVSVVIRDAILEQLKQGKPSACDIKCADFDGAEYFLFNNPQDLASFCLALKAPAAKSLLAAGGQTVLTAVYGARLTQPFDKQFDAQLTFSINGVTEDQFETFANNIATFKNHLFAAPITLRMQASTVGQVLPDLVDIPLRSASERMFIKQDGVDRITVIFSIDFTDPDDVVFGQEFTKPVSGAPTASYRPKELPLELKGITNPPVSLSQGKCPVSYLTLVVYQRHWSSTTKLQDAAFTLITLRNYLHYHIKCCKSYLHTRMRMKVDFLLKVLNRARHDAPKVQKTAGGRTFQRK